MTRGPAPQLTKRAVSRRWAAWGAAHGPAWFVRLAPPVIGCVFALTSADARRQVLRNLRLIFGRRSLWSEVRDVLVTFMEFAQALTRSLAPDRELLKTREFRVRGKRQVDPLFEQGRGILMVTAHVGPWDTAAMGLGLDVPVLMLMVPEEDDEAGDFQDRVREAASVRVLRVRESGLDALPILEHLQQGGVVVAQLDRVPRGRNPLWVRMFDRPFAMPQGLFRLAAAANVPLVPVFAARLPRGRALVDVGAPIFVPKGTRGERLAPYAQQAADRLEAHLAAFPTQWFHFSESVPRGANQLPLE